MAHGHKKVWHYNAPMPLGRPNIVPGYALYPGTDEHSKLVRDEAAAHARRIRAMWHTLHGEWTRLDWNNEVRDSIEKALYDGCHRTRYKRT